MLATPAAVIAGLTYNFLPFMILPIYASLERIDTSLIEAGKDLYASATQTFLRVTLPITAPGDRRGRAADVHPRRRRLHQRRDPGRHRDLDDRQRHPVALPARSGCYPEAAALSFVMMAAILAVVLVYLRVAGCGAFMGDEDEQMNPRGLAAAKRAD